MSYLFYPFILIYLFVYSCKDFNGTNNTKNNNISKLQVQKYIEKNYKEAIINLKNTIKDNKVYRTNNISIYGQEFCGKDTYPIKKIIFNYNQKKIYFINNNLIIFASKLKLLSKNTNFTSFQFQGPETIAGICCFKPFIENIIHNFTYNNIDILYFNYKVRNSDPYFPSNQHLMYRKIKFIYRLCRN